MKVDKIEGSKRLEWKSHDLEGEWFEGVFSLKNLEPLTNKEHSSSQFLSRVFKEVRKLNPEFGRVDQAISIRTELDFPRNWGLGSSSTLIHNLAKWSKVDAMDLCFEATNGSGYDVAQAGCEAPILYQLDEAQNPSWKALSFQPKFHNGLFFVYLGQKQDSSNEVLSFKEIRERKNLSGAIKRVNQLIDEFLQTNQLSMVEELLIEHEELLSEILERPRIQHQLFNDYTEGVVKSLGGWGGDFVMVTGKENAKEYFRNKGYEVVLRWDEMIHQ